MSLSPEKRQYSWTSPSVCICVFFLSSLTPSHLDWIQFMSILCWQNGFSFMSSVGVIFLFTWFQNIIRCRDKLKDCLETFKKFCLTIHEIFLHTIDPKIWTKSLTRFFLRSWIHVVDVSQLLPHQIFGQISEIDWGIDNFVFFKSSGCGGHLESVWLQRLIYCRCMYINRKMCTIGCLQPQVTLGMEFSWWNNG